MKKTAKVLFLILVIIFLGQTLGCKDNSLKTIRKNLNNYEINATLNDDMTLSCNQTVTYKNNSENALTNLKFNIFANAYRNGAKNFPISQKDYASAYPGGISYGNIEIFKAEENGKAISFEICGNDENILKLNLSKELFPEEKTSVYVEYKITLAKVKHRLGYTDDYVNLGNWFPILCVYDNGFFECDYSPLGDPFYSETANFKVNFTLSSAYVLASSGNIDGKEEKGHLTTYKLSQSACRDFALCLSKKFEILTEKIGETTILYYHVNDENKLQNLKVGVESFKYYNSTFGSYPYKTLSIVQTDFLYGGMEYPCLTYINVDASDKECLEIIAHENAHQWWYGLVGNNQLEESFIDEGLAEYSTLLFFEKSKLLEDYNRKSLVSRAENNYKFYVDLASQINGDTNTKMNRHLLDFKSEFEYVNTAYVKGLLMFENMRASCGEKKFLKALKNFCEDNKYKIASEGNLISAFEKAKISANGYFRAWIDGKIVI